VESGQLIFVRVIKQSAADTFVSAALCFARLAFILCFARETSFQLRFWKAHVYKS
jgi:hypothetical protein